VNDVGQVCLESLRFRFRQVHRLGERCSEQLEAEDMFWTLHEESNSIGVVIKHPHGNMRSRRTDILSPDGEKPWVTLSIPRGQSRQYLPDLSRRD